MGHQVVNDHIAYNKNYKEANDHDNQFAFVTHFDDLIAWRFSAHAIRNTIAEISKIVYK